MTFKKLNSFRGRLSPSLIAEGMNAAGRNVRRLHDDAKLLLDNGRFPTAASIAILAIEEAGKISILRQLSTATDDVALKVAWRNYRSHTAKNAQWIIAQLVADGARNLRDLAPMFDPTSDHTAIIDAVKQLGFYTDCLGEANWSEPDAVVDEEFARSIVRVANLLTPKKSITPREVELWIIHVGPQVGWANMAEGAVRFYDAMRNEGLDDNDPEHVRQFFGIEHENN